MTKFKNLDKVLDMLGRNIKNSNVIAVYGDYDVDGLCSLMTFKETLKLFPGCQFKCYPYANRTHDIDVGFVNFCLLNHVELAIICDTGTNNIEILDRLVNYGLEIIVLDHHSTANRYFMYNEKVAIISTYLDKVEHKIENVMCGAGIAFSVCAAYLERIGDDYDIGCLGVWALLAMYADSIVMDTEFGRFLYATVEGRRAVPPLVDLFLGQYMTVTRRFAEWWFAPKLNAAFRREQFNVINQLFIDETGDPFAHMKEFTNLHVSTIKMVEDLLPRVKYVDFGNIVVSNLTEFLSDNYPHNFILNHKGRIANAISSVVNKACICVCDGRDCIHGSLRDPVGREWLKYFAPLFEAGGHGPAFGFYIPYSEWHYFEAMVRKISDTVASVVKVDNEVVDLRLGVDPYILDQIAYQNEFSHANKPPTYVLASLKSVAFESHKYDDYSYCLHRDAYNSIYISSDKRILYPMDVVLYPYKSTKTKLKVVWG